MHHRRLQTIKLCAIALAAVVFVGSLLTGSAPPKTEAASPALQETTGASPSTPRVASLDATPLEVATSEGNARLLVRFTSDSKVGPEVKTVIDDRDVVLQDTGFGGDEVAGDGIYSAIIFIDFNALAENQDRVASLNNADPQPTPAPTVDPAPAPAGVTSSPARTDGTGSANAAATTTAADEESLASSDSILMPDFDAGRDRQGTLAVAKVDFRNVRPGQIVPLWPIGTHRGVDPARSLVITDIKVVEDPTRTFNPCTNVGTPLGAWTFGYLMTQMANQPRTGITPSAFVRQWLDKWMADQTTANGWTAAKRQQIKSLIIDPWEAASGGPGAPLDLRKAPFRLLGVINRIDLRNNSVYGGGSAGEGRFVFGVIDRRGNSIDPYTGQRTGGCSPTQFTVIFEYGIDRTGCAIRDWGRQWYNLRNYVLGSPAYNAALQAITDQFTRANAAPRKPNGSALNQLRTNEIAIANPFPDDTWQMREFRLPQPDGHLQEVNVKLTPDETLRNKDLTADYVNANTPLILLQQHDVPLFWLGQKFLGNHSNVPGGTFWNDGPTIFIANRQARHLFSLNTCSACHAGETNTAFTHIKPAPFGTPAGLSGFMTGINVTDPADGFPTRNFNEFKRRALDLDKLVNSPCFFDIRRDFFPLVH